MDSLIQEGLKQGIGYGLFIVLFIYVLKTTDEREKRYQSVIEKLTEKFSVLSDIKKDIQEVKAEIFK